jgi:RNA polymerase sigma-70 factor (ECF subfamily)
MGLQVVAATARVDEADLIAACVRGDRNAERTLFRREYPRVNATVYRLIGSTRDTDDLVQETFIAVFRALPRFRGESKLSTWIDKIAMRVVFQHIGARKRIPIPLDVVPDVVEDRAGALDERVHARDGLRRLYDALARLKPEARMAFGLYAIDGRSIAEVAELTGTTAITAKVRIWRARRDVHKRAASDPVLAEFLAHAGAEVES